MINKNNINNIGRGEGGQRRRHRTPEQERQAGRPLCQVPGQVRRELREAVQRLSWGLYSIHLLSLGQETTTQTFSVTPDAVSKGTIARRSHNTVHDSEDVTLAFWQHKRANKYPKTNMNKKQKQSSIICRSIFVKIFTSQRQQRRIGRR